MASTLKMQFLTAANDKVFINLGNVIPGIDSSDVKGLMDSIIAKNIFMTKSGELRDKVKAEVVTTSSTVYDFEDEEE